MAPNAGSATARATSGGRLLSVGAPQAAARRVKREPEVWHRLPHRFARDLPGARRCGNYGCPWRADTLSHRLPPSSCARRPARLMSVLVATSRDQPPPARPHSSADTATVRKTPKPAHRFSPTEKREVQLGPNPACRGELQRTEMCSECGISRLVRNGTCMKCDTCGGTSGCS